MFCFKCGAAIDDNCKFCPECGESVVKESFTENSSETLMDETGETVVYASQLNLIDTQNINPNIMNKKMNPNRAKKILILGIVLCAISVIFLVFGIKSITNASYKLATEKYDYYKSQMDETRSMARIYGSSGLFGGTYSRLASGWKNLFDDAGKTITVTRVKAGIGFGGAIVCIIFGIILVVSNGKRIKTLGTAVNMEVNSVEESYPTSEMVAVNSNRPKSKAINRTKSRSILSLLSGMCFVFSAVLFANHNGFIRIIRYGLFDYDYALIMALCGVYIGFAVLLFCGKKNIGVLIITGLLLAIHVVFLARNFTIYRFLQSVAYVLVFSSFLISYIALKVNKKFNAGVVCLLAAPLYFVGNLIYWIQYEYFQLIPYLFRDILGEIFVALGILFCSLWLVKDYFKTSK